MAKRSPIPFSAGLALLVGLGLCAQVTPVLAEVCDKVIGEWWMKQHGAFHHELLSPSFLIVLLPVAAAFILGSSLGSRFFALVLVALSGLVALNELTDPIALSAIHEGCLKSGWRSYRMTALVTAAAAILIVVFRFIRYSTRVKSVSNG
ncbi:hypothetical protein OIU35_17275 [Boseaceae bacterium BT-24-1]|nr:hypothetical protein [Boseaceae bacterium BT-24-1]